MPVSRLFLVKCACEFGEFGERSERGMRSVQSAGLVNFASAASFIERGTRSVPSARPADSGGLGAQPPAGSRGSAPGGEAPEFFLEK